jgi:uncharacterized membrane protein
MLHNDYDKNTSQNNLPAKSSTQNIAQTVYVLQLISIFTAGLFSLIPLIITYIFWHQARNSWLDSHFRWQIQTFWFSTLFYILAWIFGFIPIIGWMISIPSIILATGIIIVRSVKGWKKLSIQKPPQNLIE